MTLTITGTGAVFAGVSIDDASLTGGNSEMGSRPP
jgi:hypothetical protein